MSNLVFPSLPGLDWNCTRTVVPPPVQVRTTPSQREYRARDAVYPRYQYSLSYEFLRSGSAQEYQTLLAFHSQHGGDFDSFLYTDPDDNLASSVQFGVGNGATSQYQLVRSMGGFYEPISAVNGDATVEMTGGVGGVGSFEVDSNADGLADGWTLFIGDVGDAGRTHTLLRASESYSVQHATYYQYVRIDSATNANDSGILIATNIPIQPSTTYSLFGNALCSVANKAYLLVRQYRANGTLITDTPSAYVSGVTNSPVTMTYTSHPEASYIQIMYRGINGAGQAMRIDGLTHVKGSTPSVPTATKTALLPGPDYSITDGIITFNRVPAAGALLSWSGNFYRRCRFLRGPLEFRQFMQDYWEAKKVELISVKAGSQ